MVLGDYMRGMVVVLRKHQAAIEASYILRVGCIGRVYLKMERGH